DICPPSRADMNVRWLRKIEPAGLAWVLTQPPGSGRRTLGAAARPGASAAEAWPRTAAGGEGGGGARATRPARWEGWGGEWGGGVVGGEDRVDAGDLTAGDLERHHGDQPALWVEIERSRAAVDLDGAQRHARKAGAPAGPVDQRARDPGTAVQRPRERRDLAV